MATTITKSVSVSDICKKATTTATTKTCSSVVTGDTSYVEAYAIAGTSGGTACCSSTTDLCMNAWVGCPLVFETITWKDTITVDGQTYALKSATSGGSTSVATYEPSAKQLTAPSMEATTRTYNDLKVKFTNSNSVAVACYFLIDPDTAPSSADDIINSSHYTTSIEANSTATEDIGWNEDLSSTTIYACFVTRDQATGYDNSPMTHTSFTRPTITQLTAPTLTEENNSYDSYSVKVTNPNSVAVTFYSQDLISDYGGSVDISANSSTEITLSWGTTATSHTVKGYLSANGYKDSSNGSVTVYRPAETQYTLTVNYYISGVASGTKYYDLGGSSLVNISTYKETISGSVFSYSDPSSNFSMDNKNQTLNMYYLKKLTSATLTEGNKDFYQYDVSIYNPNDVDCDFYSQDLSDYGGSVIVEAKQTKTITLSWGVGSTSHTFSGYLSATNYTDSTTNSITIDRPSITSLVKPTLAVQNELTSEFDLWVYNSNEVEVKWYYGYTSSPTTYGGTISKESSSTITLAKNTSKTIYVKFVYEDLSSQESKTIPYIEPTTQLKAPTITLNDEKTTNAVYYYTIKNTNDIATSVYINGVKQEKLLESNSEQEYSGSWSAGAVSITITAKLGTLSSSYTDSNEATLEIDRPKIKLPNPELTELTSIKTYNRYGFNYRNKSSQYSVQPFFNGSSQGDILGPSGDRDYTFDWGTGETSKTFYVYAMPTGDTTQFTSSDRVTITIERPKTLTIPEITNIQQSETSVTLTIYNDNDTSVLWFVDNVQQDGAITNKQTKTYTYTWGTGETSKTFSIKFKDPTSQYGDSNVLTKTIEKEKATLLDPVLSSSVTETSYTISITNKNEEPTVTYYVDGVSKGTIAYNEIKTFTGEWASGEKSKTLVIKFTADNYEDSTKSITVNKPGVVSIAAPNLSLIENTTKSYKIRISNPNTTEGTYYLVDSSKTKIGDITLSAGVDYDYEKEWGEEETSKTFSCGLMYVDGEDTVYSEISTLEEFTRPLNTLEKPVLSENVNNYTTSKFNVKNTNESEVTWFVNGAQQSTKISKDNTATFSYDWQENEKTKRFTVKFTATNYDPSESYIDLTRPNKLVEPIVELLVNSHENYKVRIKNKNNVAVTLGDGTTIAANSKLIVDGTWGTETTKTLTYYFKADNYGQSESVSITFSRINEDDYFTLYINIDGTVYQIGKKYTLPIATDTVLGGVKLGYTNSGRNYKIQKDTEGNIFVNVPWTDTVYSLPTASSSNKGGVKVSGSDGVYMDGETLKAKVDNSSIQVGTSGLETKIDGTTIVKGTNGLQAKQVSVTVNDTTKDILIEIK